MPRSMGGMAVLILVVLLIIAVGIWIADHWPR